jgi:hypothetical protein
MDHPASVLNPAAVLLRNARRFIPKTLLLVVVDSNPNSEVELALPGQSIESELPASITSTTERVFGFLGSNPSPVTLRLMKTPAARHPLPKGEGDQRLLISALSLGERVARVASRVRGFFPQSNFGIRV